MAPDRLAAQCGDGLGTLAELLGEARERLARGRACRVESVDWRALLDGPLPELVRSGEVDSARAILSAAIGQ